MLRPSRRWLVFLVLVLALLSGRRSSAEGDLTVRLTANLEVSPAGDRKARVEIVWGPQVYAAIKENSPNPRRFLQDMAPDRAAYEVANASARYDDARQSVVLEMTEIAAARNRGGGRWELEPEPTATLDHTSPEGAARPTAYFKVKGDFSENLHYEGEYVCALPPGATGAQWDDTTKVLSWSLDAPAGAGQPRLTADLRVRDRVMSTVYKIYGLESDKNAFWLAKTVFKNVGKGVARNVKIRYRLQGYGEWSPWEKRPEVVPGQTIVSVHYPVLEASIARIKNNTAANLLLEYQYEDESGRKIEDDEAKKLVILGVNEFVFGNLAAGQSFGTWQEEYNNANLLAAWVSRNDGAIKQFAAMANRMAGGVGASTNDASAIKVLKACYELLQRNDFTYQHPPALKDKSVSFDARDVQNVKFPRETLRDRSGTCIDLAILYAAMVNALGLEPHLALIPGHCFPLVRLPSGRLVGVETTGVQGGLRVGSAAFKDVQPYADEEYDKAKKDGRIYEIDVRSLWTSGISNPELDDLPADILERWHISEEGRGGPRPTPTPADDTTTTTTDTTSADSVVGVLWGGTMGAKLDDGGMLDSFVLGIDKKGAGYEAATRADITLADNRKVVVITEYTGEAKPAGILFESTSRKRTVNGGAEELLTQAFMLVKPKGTHVEARVGNDKEGYTDFTLVPKKDEDKSGEAEKVRGSWGGEMPHAKLSENVILDEMYVNVPAAGAFAADIRLECTVLKDDQKIPVTIRMQYRDGRVEGDSVHFAIVPWHRTVPSTGQKDDIEGNPLVLHLTAEGKLAGQFEGGDGWPFTLLRNGATPTTTTAKGPFDDLAGAWGGGFSDAKLNDELLIRAGTLDFAKKPYGGEWSATVHFTFVVVTPTGNVVVKVDGDYPPGRIEGDAIKFPAVQLTRTIVSTGAKNQMDSNPMELRREPDGRLEVKFVGDGGFTLTMARR